MGIAESSDEESVDLDDKAWLSDENPNKDIKLDENDYNEYRYEESGSDFSYTADTTSIVSRQDINLNKQHHSKSNSQSNSFNDSEQSSDSLDTNLPNPNILHSIISTNPQIQPGTTNTNMYLLQNPNPSESQIKISKHLINMNEIEYESEFIPISEEEISFAKNCYIPTIGPNKEYSNNFIEKKPLKTFYDEYEVYEIIGNGSFAVVYRGMQLESQSEVAIKITKKSTELIYEMLKREVNITMNLNHKNIIRCIGFYEEENEYFIINELMKGGELIKRIGTPALMNETNIKGIIISILKALYYIHKRGIIHRDLKPENIMFKNTWDLFDIKLTDFGFGKILNGELSCTVCGTLDYIAPEVLERKYYDNSVDMWSLGVIVYYLLTRRLPFKTSVETTQIYNIKNGIYNLKSSDFTPISEYGKDFVRHLLQINPLNRLTDEKALLHPFLRSCEYYTELTKDIEMKRMNDIRYEWKKTLENEYNNINYKINSVDNIYEINDKIDDGLFGSTFEAYQKITKIKVIVKKIEIKRINNLNGLLNNLRLLLSIDHDGFNKYYQIEDIGKYINIISERIDGIPLLLFLESLESYSQIDLINIIYEILISLRYLHNIHVNHGNVKPENIYICYDDDKFIVKLSDAGLYRHYIKDFSKFTFFLDFYSPEILINNYNDEENNGSIDIWSVGVLVYLLFSGHLPFHNISCHTINSQIYGKYSFKQFVIWNSISYNTKTLIMKMLSVNSNERITANDCLNHPFFTKCNDEELINLHQKSVINGYKHYTKSYNESILKYNLKVSK